MINCDFLIFHHCNHCIKEYITLLTGWFYFLNSIYELKTKQNLISVEREIGVIFFKSVQIIWWYTDTDSLINGKIDFWESITDIQNHGNESIHSPNINVDSEGSIMCHRTVVMIKINTFNIITPICTLACNEFSFIITISFLNTRCNE